MNVPPLPLAIICDLDGTLALLGDRSPYDASRCLDDVLNEPIAHILKTYQAIGVHILVVSGREAKHRKPTDQWLQQHGIVHAALHMRPTHDFRKDAVMKTEVFERHIRGKFDVLFVLEDRNQVVDMWRGLGLTCLQVAPGDF